MRTLELLDGVRLLSLVGCQGSGKTTIGNKLAAKLQTRAIEVSSVVREENPKLQDLELAKSGSRTKSDPNWLGSKVFHALHTVYQEQPGKSLVLTGARENEVIYYLASEGMEIYQLALTADPFTRYNRLTKQGRVKSIEEFLTREVAERQLGLMELIDSAPFNIPTSDKTKPSNIAEAIIDRLKSKGVRL